MDELRRSLGIYALGLCAAEPVEDASAEAFARWRDEGNHADMKYLERYDEVRRDPRLLLQDAKSLIVCVFPYYTSYRQPEGSLPVAMYARGDDYHVVVRERLERLAAYVKNRYGGETRACVDTAPLRERYWAARAGIGFIGRNGCLIVPGAGSYFFIGTVLSTLAPEELSDLLELNDRRLPSSCNLEGECEKCGRCVRACPTGALNGYTVDARRCLSYLTIEHKGDFPEGTDLHGAFFGCDRCQAACPHNAVAVETDIKEFTPRAEICEVIVDRHLSVGEFVQDTDYTESELQDFEKIFPVRPKNSAIRRVKPADLLRNLRYCLRSKSC